MRARSNLYPGLAALLTVAAVAFPSPPSPSQEIRPGQFDKLLALVKPQPDESAWAEIPWMINLWEARKKAAVEGKPLVVWTMSGEPLGAC